MKQNLRACKRRGVAFNLEVFSEDELDEIHLATLEVLEQTGVFVEDEKALKVYDGGGKS